MKGKLFNALLFLSLCYTLLLPAQDAVTPRPITLEEYEKAKTFEVKDLDNDTYIKIDNVYILDRYEMRKPYFITGDDGLKKRIDLYRIFAKTGMEELGVMIFYTNEKGTRYKAVLPNFTADANIWELYFEDIHKIDKEEENFVLKLSYVLSKEFSFQLYKAINHGKDLSKESATYGNDICFPGSQLITLSNGNKRYLTDIKPGDQVLSVDPVSQQPIKVTIKELVQHESKNYAITRLLLIAPEVFLSNEILLKSKVIEATPNHPMKTSGGDMPIGQIKEWESVLCYNEKAGIYEPFLVFDKTEYAGGEQKVYSMIANEGETFLVNDVMVLQKH